MSLSYFSVTGITLIILDIYFHGFAKKLEAFIIEFPDYLLFGTAELLFILSKKYFRLMPMYAIAIGLLVVVLEESGASWETVHFFIVVFAILMGIPCAVGFLMVWSPVVKLVFQAFGYLTKGKALAGIGLVLAILDIVL